MSEQVLEWIDPAELVVGDNVRDGEVDVSDLIGSVKDGGVRQPIECYRDDENRVVVVCGQRRTLAAREAKRSAVPVLIGPAPSVKDRLVNQFVENEARRALTNRQRVQAVQDMLDAGMSQAQVAKRTGTKRGEVAKTATVAGSGIVGQLDTLTLDQAVTLAEFEDDPEVVADLIKAAENGHFDHRVSRVRQDREVRKSYDETCAQLSASGVRVVDEPRWNNDGDPVPLYFVRDDGGELIPEEVHQSCPGHAVFLRRSFGTHWQTPDGALCDEEEVYALREETDADEDEDEGESFEDIVQRVGLSEYDGPVHRTEPCCTEPHRHHRIDKRDGSTSAPVDEATAEAEREAARVERQRVIENNKAWRAAEPVRRKWLATLATRKTPPTGAEQFIAQRLASYTPAPSYDDCRRVGLDDQALREEATACTAKRALVIAVTVVLAAWEAGTSVETWRHPGEMAPLMLAQMAEWGYGLSEVEQAIVDGAES